jgi:response regulator RpfG family c-di-GMP phosphodiesterase
MARILIVDDERSIRVTLCALLGGAGHEVEAAEDAPQAREMLARARYDVVLSDIVLAGMTGVELLKTIRQEAPDVQVIMMTGEPTVETATEAVRAGACDYLTKPINKEAILRVVGTAAKTKALEDEKRQLAEAKRQYQADLERQVESRTHELREANARLQATMEDVIGAMASAVEFRDPYTAGHQQRVANLARAIGMELGLGESRVKGLYLAGVIHDLGKISVPAEILSKPSRLSEPEFALIKAHPQTGDDILQRVRFPWPIAEMVLQHHERMDGSGYPRGLRDDAIMLESRILVVADVVEAMASHRPYRPALGLDAALAEIRQRENTAYDGQVAQACARMFREKGFRFEDAEHSRLSRSERSQETRVTESSGDRIVEGQHDSAANGSVALGCG